MLMFLLFQSCELENETSEDQKKVELVQGVWYEETHSSIGQYKGKKRVFSGNDYEVYLYDEGHYLVEKGTFTITDGVFIETATHLLDSDTEVLREVELWDVVVFEHPSAYFSEELFSLTSYSGLVDDLTGEWERGLEGPYYAMGNDGLFKYLEYDNRIITFGDTTTDTYSKTSYYSDGSLNNSDTKQYSLYNCVFNDMEWSYTTDSGSGGYMKSKIVNTLSENQLLLTYYQKVY